MLLMDLMINNAYNNTIAEKSQLREASYEKTVSGGGRDLWALFCPYKIVCFPVILIELCLNISFIMSLCSLKKLI